MTTAGNDKAVCADGRDGGIRMAVWRAVPERVWEAVDAQVGVAAGTLTAPQFVAEGLWHNQANPLRSLAAENAGVEG